MNDGEKAAREQILKLAGDYCDRYHAKKPYEQGDRIPYASRVYDREEMCNLIDSALDFWLTAGRYCDRFEDELAQYLGVKHVAAVNSGSSANLLAFWALTSPLLGERAVKRGDEVITVAAGFPTTVAPVIQFGAVPVFVDVELSTANIDVNLLERAVSGKTGAVMLAHTLGNPFNIKAVTEFCSRHGLWLIEDNCDALGSEYTLNGVTRKTGTFGDIGTSSFYPPHHMTMGEGGAVYTDNALLNKIVRSLRDWGRDCVCPSGTDNLCTHRFDGQYGTLPRGYDHKYVYSHFGFNLKPTDMQCAIGCAQLKKLDGFTKRRRENYAYMYNALAPYKGDLMLPEPQPASEPSWFGFLITCRRAGLRDKLVAALEGQKIQTRMLFAGNLTRHPCMQGLVPGTDYRIVASLENTDCIMNNAFWTGMYPGMTAEMLDSTINVIAGQ